MKMPSMPGVLRTSRYILLFVLVLHVSDGARGDILSVGGAVCSGNRCRYVVEVPRGSSWRLTPAPGARGDVCGPLSQEYDISELADTSGSSQGNSRIVVTVPVESERLYLCRHDETQRPLAGRWIHQGTNVFLEARPESESNSTVKPVQPESRSFPVGSEDAARNRIDVDLQAQNQAAESSHTQVPEEKQNLDAAETNELESNDSLNNKEEAWQDLSHDIDVNNEASRPRLTREEARDILVRTPTQMDQYVPLSELDSEFRNIGDNENDSQEKSGSNEFISENEFDIKLPQVYADVKQIRELGAKYREIEDISQENTVIDLIETLYPNDERLDEAGRVKRELGAENDESTTENSEVAEQTAAIVATPLQAEAPKVANETVTVVNNSMPVVRIQGIRIDKSDKEPEVEETIPSLLTNDKVTMRVFGVGLSEKIIIRFTHDQGKYGSPCNYPLKGDYQVVAGSVDTDGTTAQIMFIAPEPIANDTLYICANNQTNPDAVFIHQGSEEWVTLMTHNRPLALWMMIVLILICLLFAALFSGLNLGLMALDRTELKIIANTGTETEKKYARAIQPVRDHGNYLLCSILLGNVAVNSTCAVLLEDLMPGVLAVILSTLLIVCLGEIVPQAICSRHGLLIGAKSIIVTKALMGVTAPLAYPISKMLDYFLGEELGNVYNRERLKELVKVTNDLNDLDKDEVNIISGALELRKKTVTEVMTPIEDVFMLPSDSVLDFETMSEIVKSGYSRIPVYEASRNNIVTVLFIKDLAFVDPDDNTPLRTLCQFYQNSCNFVFEDTTLDVMFRQFKEGHKGHMAFVHRVNNDGEGDPFYQTVGLVTLEDVIEEMIQAEIVDETDVFMDNRSKLRRHRPTNKLQEFAAFAERRDNQRIRISPQLTLATFQFLTSGVDAFKPDMVSETVLRRLLRQDIINQIKCKGKDKQDPSTLVYTQGKPADYFVLILEGRVEVTVGRENLVFEAGPFTYFGVQALTQNINVPESQAPSTLGSLQNLNMDAMLRYTFIPDYSVRAITELFYITIKRSLYLAAKRATLMEKTSSHTKGSGDSAGEQFDSEVDKLLQSLDEDGSIAGDQLTAPKKVSPILPPVSASHQTRSAFASPAAAPARAPAPAAPAPAPASAPPPAAAATNGELDEARAK